MLLAIVPAYNEEKTIGSVIQSLFNPAHQALDAPVQGSAPPGVATHVDAVVVVDDGSNDRTGEIAAQAGAIVLRHELNRGQGAALETGHEYARMIGAEYVLHFDGDGQFDVFDIGPALEKLKSSAADVLFGSRFLDNRSNVPWLKRRVFLPLARFWHNLIHGTDLTDIHNGFRILNRRALDSIRITQDRMAHASEIPTQAARAGLKNIELPVRVVYREYGQKISGGLQIVHDLILGTLMSKNK